MRGVPVPPWMPVRPRARRARGPPPRRPARSEWVIAGRTYYNRRILPIEVGVDDEGRIAAVGRNLRGGRRHDVGDRLILPAATDLHVHFRHPDDPRGVESWGTGTVQAALGGVGLAGEMPNSEPPVTTAERLVERRAAGEGRLAVDLLLYGALTTPARAAPLARECGAFKLYMAPTTGIEPETDDGALVDRLRAVARTGLALTVHAEDPDRFRSTTPPPRTLAEWDEARPAEAEISAIRTLLSTAPPELRLHVAHVTTTAAAAALREAGVSFEVTPHHLLLSTRSAGGARLKTNPPLRDDPTRSELREAWGRGEVPCLASDHAPHPLEGKERPFPLAPSGVPGVATLLPLFLAGLRTGDVDLGRLLASTCDRPARWLGVPMGRIAVGHRANLLVVDPKERATVRAERLPAPVGWTPFEGWEAVFPQEHYLDGGAIVLGGEYVGRPVGKFVRPEYAPPPAPEVAAAR